MNRIRLVTTLTFCLFLIALSSVTYAAMPEDLVLYMSFDEGTVDGDEVIDVSTYGNNGTVVGAPKVVDGYRNEALDFNGSSDSVEIVTSESLAETAGEITMEAWVFRRVLGTNEIISKWDNAMNGIIHFEARNDGGMRFCMRKDDDSKVADFNTTETFPTEKWTHIAEVYDGGTAIVYFDGVEAGSMDGAGEMRENENAKWWIGSMYATDRWFDGLIDEVCIWKKALSVDEIEESMEGTLISAAVSKNGKLASLWAGIKKNR
jgi:hypothetical protein